VKRCDKGKRAYVCKKRFPNQYVEIRGSFTWITAKRECQEIGRELASVHSQVEQDYLYTYTLLEDGTWEPEPSSENSRKFWIGLNNQDTPDEFVW